jgi:Spy/CpxP family protein refolding chaperone
MTPHNAAVIENWRTSMKHYAVALTLMLVPSVLLAQVAGRQGGRRGGPEALQRNVIEIIIQKKAELSLTAEQVAQLEPIGKKLDEDNKPVVETLAKLRGTGMRDLTDEQRAELRTQMETLRENRMAALEQANAVLSSDQQAKLREVLRQQMRGRGGPRRGR